MLTGKVSSGASRMAAARGITSLPVNVEAIATTLAPAAGTTLAMAHAQVGEFEKALTWQRALISVAGESPDRPRLEANLKRYEQKLTCCVSR